MFHTAYEKMVQYASDGELAEELVRARAEFLERTGELFESDATYERRIAAFLEWYVLDRRLTFDATRTPVQLYIDRKGPQLEPEELRQVEQFTQTELSLYEFRGAKPETMRVTNLLTNRKLDIFERRKPAGLESGDIMEARVIPHGDLHMFSEVIAVHPREARKIIRKAAKKFRKSSDPEAVQERLDLVHRVAFLSNRCDRYAHVDPKQIFLELG